MSRHDAPHAQWCPKCKKPVHRSRATRIDHIIRKKFTSLRLFRCSTCGWRGWLMPIEPSGESLPVERQPLDLVSLDRAMGIDDEA